MDLKLRIIIAFFSVIALFYICQFIISYMSKKEHFSSRYYDDVEKYEDAPTSAGASAGKSNISEKPNESADAKTDNYDLRIFLLKQIDTLNITDSTVKTDLMQKLFTDDSMKQLKPMSNEQRIQKVNDVFHEAHGSKIAQQTLEVDKDTESLHNQIKNSFNSEKEKLSLPEMKDYFDNDFKNRVDKASDKLDNVIDGLKDLKDILKGSDSRKKETYIPDLPIPPPAPSKPTSVTTSTANKVAPTIASTSPSVVTAPSPSAGIERYTERSIASLSPPILSQAAGFAAPSQLIEGFENIRSYALY